MFENIFPKSLSKLIYKNSAPKSREVASAKPKAKPESWVDPQAEGQKLIEAAKILIAKGKQADKLKAMVTELEGGMKDEREDIYDYERAERAAKNLRAKLLAIKAAEKASEAKIEKILKSKAYRGVLGKNARKLYYVDEEGKIRGIIDTKELPAEKKAREKYIRALAAIDKRYDKAAYKKFYDKAYKKALQKEIRAIKRSGRKKYVLKPGHHAGYAGRPRPDRPSPYRELTAEEWARRKIAKKHPIVGYFEFQEKGWKEKDKAKGKYKVEMRKIKRLEEMKSRGKAQKAAIHVKAEVRRKKAAERKRRKAQKALGPM